jgi:hypothetical protein
MDGKKITENQLKNFTKEKDEKKKEETYDPRKNRLLNGIVILNNIREVRMLMYSLEQERI